MVSQKSGISGGAKTCTSSSKIPSTTLEKTTTRILFPPSEASKSLPKRKPMGIKATNFENTKLKAANSDFK
jgi:hypothetical protein